MKQADMNRKRIVIYEKLSYLSLISFVYYYLRKYDVRYFSITGRFENSFFFNRLRTGRSVYRIDWGDFEYVFHMQSHDIALKHIEDIYSKNFSGSALLIHFSRFINSEMIHLVYKKELTLKLQSFFETTNILNAIADKEAASLSFIPGPDYYLTGKYVKKALASCIEIPLTSSLFNFIHGGLKKIYLICALFLFPVAIILLKTRSISKKPENKRSYLVGFRVYKEDWAFLFKYRKIDFLIDNEKLTRENTVFCIETEISDDYFNQLKEKGYNTVDIRNILKSISLDYFINTVLKKAFPCSIRAGILALRSPFYFIEATIGIIFYYMRWTAFLEKYVIKNYVVYTDFEKFHVVRNILLNQSGTENWYYIHSIHHGDLFEKKSDEFTIRHVFYSYLFYNNIVSWGNVCRMIFERTPNYISCFRNVGCLWSEHVLMASGREKVQMPGNCNFPDQTPGPGTCKVIGLFDTSFGKGAIIQLDEIISYFKGILMLLNKHPEIRIVFKQKKEWDEMVLQLPEIEGDFREIFDELLAHDRFDSAGRLADTCEVIADSDLVISACFTSTTSEALGACKKALYFDSDSKYRDCYFDKFPKMVAHGYDELEEYVNYWLYEINDREFGQYLEEYVKGELDATLEGKGITGFRNLLVQER